MRKFDDYRLLSLYRQQRGLIIIIIMTLTYESDLDKVKMNHCARYIRRSKVSARTYRHTYTTGRLLYTAATVVAPVRGAVDASV